MFLLHYQKYDFFESNLIPDLPLNSRNMLLHPCAAFFLSTVIIWSYFF
jgi:hypothetical protein